MNEYKQYLLKSENSAAWKCQFLTVEYQNYAQRVTTEKRSRIICSQVKWHKYACYTVYNAFNAFVEFKLQLYVTQ